VDLAHDISEGFAKGETGEATLDSFISKRHDQRVKAEGERQAEEMWAESVRRYNAQQRERHRAEWYAYHAAQAERVERTAAQIAADHRAQAQKLLEPNGETDRGEGSVVNG
jgi:hypothetical protein